ncbi:MAG: type II toxin-antitoxin system ParD family antitoxin [Pyrinomonadaceae bacterium]|nr:type II toxin-antitoxin system ParD family antitoxin [Pyrinomonadaceae bacterium]
MNVSLTNELESFVSRLVATGDYHSASEVVRDGLRLLKEREELKQLRLEELRAEVRKGYEQSVRGESRPLDIEGVKKRARSRK